MSNINNLYQRRSLIEIHSDLQREWEKVYLEKWIPRAVFAALFYQMLNREYSTEYYSNIITTILDGRVPPFWSCVDPKIEAEDLIEADKPYPECKDFYMKLIHTSVPTEENVEIKDNLNGGWGMFVNPNLLRVIKFLNKKQNVSIEEIREAHLSWSKEHTLDELNKKR